MSSGCLFGRISSHFTCIEQNQAELTSINSLSDLLLSITQEEEFESVSDVNFRSNTLHVLEAVQEVTVGVEAGHRVGWAIVDRFEVGKLDLKAIGDVD